MNNLLKKLERQSTIEVPHEREWDATSLVFSKEKFAELIVRECASLVPETAGDQAGTYRDQIFEHFGIGL